MKALLTLAIVAVILAVFYAVERWFDRYRPAAGALVRILVALVLAVVVFFAAVNLAPARDLGQWEASDPVIREWYQTLMRPDQPNLSCCGEADAYYADEIRVRGGKTFAVVTDTRPDVPLGRPHIPPGTEVEVPNEKLKWDRSNPTGHNVLFVSRGLYAYCFVQGTGI